MTESEARAEARRLVEKQLRETDVAAVWTKRGMTQAQIASAARRAEDRLVEALLRGNSSLGSVLN
jgi:hypothetical protein